MSKITVYRLEHFETGLGPFEHIEPSGEKNQVLIVKNAINTEAGRFMPDLENDTVKKIFKQFPNAIFGWNTIEKYLTMIKDQSIVDQYGFGLMNYEVEPLYIGECGQVIFLREYDTK